MATTFEIPLTPQPQSFRISLAGTTYVLTFTWCSPASCWMLEIADSNGVDLIGSVPMVTGLNLLDQFNYLRFGFQLFAFTDNNPSAPPTFNNLGITGRVQVVLP